MTDRCIVVFGPGRSGTSLTMKLLDQAGLRLSTELVPASEENPDGHFEDLAISVLQQDFLQSLDLSPYRPRPADWASAASYSATRTGLIAAVQAEVGASPERWGFKDPRTCLTWPMWQEIFATIDVEPAAVFCTRDAASVVRSLMKAYGFPQSRAESLYLYRCLHALEDVSEPWFFVQYSEFMTNGVSLLADLTQYCSIDTSTLDVSAIVSENVRESLNRQSDGPSIELSGVVREMDELLGECVGTNYDAGLIAEFCASVSRRVDDFKFVSDALEMSRAQSEPTIAESARRSLGQARRVVSRLRAR